MGFIRPNQLILVFLLIIIFEMKYINVECSDRICTIVLNRPDKRNALNFQLVSELREALKNASTDDKVKVIIIKGSGNTFCAGADLAYLQQLQKNTYEDNLADSEHLMQLYYSIYTMDKIVIAQVEGFAIAGGVGLATVCDFVYASSDAVFGYSEVKIGFVPAIVMTFLLRKIGETHARELLLTGNRIIASKAKEIGMINEVFPLDQLSNEVLKFADMLCNQNSGQSMALTKQMIAAIQAKDLSTALHYAAEKNARARSFVDCKKGIEAFLNKEKISW